VDQREQSIRLRAYELWERAGHSGSPEEHWFPAEHSLGYSAEMNRSKELSRPGANPGAFVAQACGTQLRSFYDSLPVQPPPLRYWELAIELAVGPNEEFRSLLSGQAPVVQPIAPGGVSLSG